VGKECTSPWEIKKLMNYDDSSSVDMLPDFAIYIWYLLGDGIRDGDKLPIDDWAISEEEKTRLKADLIRYHELRKAEQAKSNTDGGKNKKKRKRK